MGLTIHYSLQSDTRSERKARSLVEQLRQRAMDLPFENVGEIVEAKGGRVRLRHRDRGRSATVATRAGGSASSRVSRLAM